MNRVRPPLGLRWAALLLLPLAGLAPAPPGAFSPTGFVPAASAQKKGGGVELTPTRPRGGRRRGGAGAGPRGRGGAGVKLPPRPSAGPDPAPCVAKPVRVSPGKTLLHRTGMELVALPPGEFCMGSTNGNADERPPHRVKIGYPFLLGKHEVTQTQWAAVMGEGNNPSHFKGFRLPVEQVSWDDVQEFIRRLNDLDENVVYRLPSEAEWEYAARAGTTDDDPFDVSASAWVYENSGDRPLSADSPVEPEANNNQTHPVGTKEPNGFGLYDMHGNVWEWCLDDYHESYRGAPGNGKAWRGGGARAAGVARGGSWYFRARSARPANRYKLERGGRFASVGFRVAATWRPGRHLSSVR